ncbi:MAG: hypothetical protein JSW57_05725 [Flavobacteriaceae bacterium]|nr:MAG: hypothetical protein JSW57_05725 [Flavobacteriaceae bacterium]
MLHFFRKIRRELLANSQTIRYLKYGIGEIILVVIGILIAIQVDNWNEERIAAEKTKLLFQGVSDELVQNIDNIDRRINEYIDKDSFYFKVLNKRVNYEDYIASPNLFGFVFGWDRVSLVDDGFKELLAGKNNLTEFQDSIFIELKDLYGKRKINTDRDDQMIHESHLSFRDRMKEQAWHLDFTTGSIITDAMIQYALNDPLYLNELGELRQRETGRLNGMLWFRTKALNLYKKIAEMLKTEKDTSLIKDIEDFERLKGVYVWNNYYGDNKVVEVKSVLRGENELKLDLYVNDTLRSEWDVHPFYDSHLIFYIQEKGENRLARCVFGENGEIVGLIWLGFITEEDGERQMSKKIK